MQTGNGNGAEAEPITSINITPLVDVSLVLVIIFMVTMPFLVERGLKVKHSLESVVKTSSVSEPILVEITAAGLSIEGRETPQPELAAALAKLIKERGNNRVAVTADRNVPHGRVVEILDAVSESGAGELNLLQPKPKEEANGRG
jgi:biopolymer transport protein TolR